MRSRFVPLIIGMILTSAPDAPAETVRVEMSDPTSPVELRVEIEWGAIRIVGTENAVGLTVETVADRPGEVAGSLVRVSEEGNLINVEQSPLPSGAFRSANLEIVTPLATNLNLRINRGGDVRVSGVRGLVEVTNLNGSVELEAIDGAAAVNASNGAISAGFTRVDRDRDLLFTSLNGSVDLCLPADFSGRLHLTTAGDSIQSDFPIDREETARVVEPGGELEAAGSEVRGRIGSNGSLLRVSTLNGEIRLERCG